MYHKIGIIILALSLGGAIVLNVSPASAQQDQQEEKKQTQGKSRGGGGGGNAISKRGDGARRAIPNSTRRASPQRKTQTTNRRKAVTGTPRTNTQRKVYTAKPRNVAPKGTAKVYSPDGGKRVGAAGKLRGASHAKIRGRNFSAWRGKHRVRHNNAWRTFVGLSALGAIVYGSNEYYPYAYLSASEPYCDGLTDDGCVLRWREVQTIEGDVIDQCVACLLPVAIGRRD